LAFHLLSAQQSLFISAKLNTFSQPMTLREPEIVEIQTPSGTMRTMVVRPAATGKYPGLLFHSEIFQITGPIHRTAAFLAGHGFVVALPEIYHEFLPAGSALAYDQKGSDIGNQLKIEKSIQAYDADNRAVIDLLKQHEACTGRIGSFGPCIGGHLTYRAALQPDVSAAACFYPTDLHKRSLGFGMNDDSLARAAEIHGELMIVFGRQDPHVPAEGRELIYKTLSASGVNFTWHEVNAAHAFLRDEGLRYDAELFHQFLGITVNFFRRVLGQPS
jgi:carboxymethylenebutenolidase